VAVKTQPEIDLRRKTLRVLESALVTGVARRPHQPRCLVYAAGPIQSCSTWREQAPPLACAHHEDTFRSEQSRMQVVCALSCPRANKCGLQQVSRLGQRPNATPDTRRSGHKSARAPSALQPLQQSVAYTYERHLMPRVTPGHCSLTCCGHSEDELRTYATWFRWAPCSLSLDVRWLI